MNREQLLLTSLLVLGWLVAALADTGGNLLEDPYAPEFVVAAQDTIPLEDRFDDFLTNPSNNPFDLEDPEIVEKNIEYDPETGTYLISETIGEDYFRMPSYMTFEEYLDYRAKQQERAYFDELLGVSTGEGTGGKIDPINQFDIKNSLVDRLFGGTEVNINPQGSIDLTFGVDFQRVDNPALLERQRNQGGFDFDMAIQMDVQGSIGEKLNLSFNYNTQATFDFENPMKIDYNTDNFSEDEILKKIEAGNVSLPLRGTLIQGNQSLFGIKTELQFGKLWLTAVASQQKSERESITVQGGAQFQEFEVRADEYDENRHFFLSHYNRNVFEESLENLPQIKSLFRIEKIQVWVTNDRREFQNVREVVAIADMGEPNRNKMTIPANVNPTIQPPTSPVYRDITGEYGLPDNAANPIAKLITENPRTKLVDRVVSELRQPPFSFQQPRDFEKVTARQLQSSEFTYHPELGFLSVNINVEPDQVLGVAYQYSYKDSTYQVGQFADDVPQSGDSIQDQKVLFVKMLKSSTQRVDLPSWDLMMKNVYSIGAFQVNREDFKLDIYYEEPGGGEKRFLPETAIAGEPLLNVFNLDKLNTQGDPQPDGVFDFVPGVTINPQNGRIMFPRLEPFGSALAEQIPDPVDSALYVYQSLYDSTKIRAREQAYLNRFIIQGSYKSTVSSEISLGAFNIPPGSVVVYAGGQRLEEGRDFEIDYNIGRVRILNDALLASGVPIRVDFEDNTLFGFQTKTLLGLRADYKFSDNFTLGGTFLHLFERPFTPKVNIGDDPINNRIFGLDLNYSSEAPWLTKLVDKIPLIDTKEPSNISVMAEAAFLKPGHARAINENAGQDKGGVVYIDDFEGSISPLPLHVQPLAWVLSSVPQNDERNNNPLFPEADEEGTVLSGVNRGLLNWYRIDDAVRDPNDPNPYTARILQTEVFRNFTNPTLNEFLNTAQTFDITFYPNQRGPYNFDPPEGTAYSSGMSPDGSLKDPRSRWGGIMRAINTNDFQAANVEFIEFWMMSPFLDPSGNGNPIPNPQAHEGYIYFNLGNVSEDILRDSRKFFENGLPTPDQENPESRIVRTQWGKVPVSPQITTAFDADPERRAAQDVGFDGLNNAEEMEFFQDYIDKVQAAGIGGPVLQNILNDPSNDDYIYYNNDSAYANETEVLRRYIRYNNSQGNTPSASEASGQNTVTFGRTQPDMEDINNDLTLNETESYFQYRVPITWDGDIGIDMGNEFVTDSVENADRSRIWYRFKVPLELPAENPNFKRVGGIQDFRSIRFIRMYMTGFQEPVTLRFARLDLVRNQWRRYILPSGNAIPQQGPLEEGEGVFDVNDINIEENSSREPFSYILPPGITRERAIGVNQQALQNETALSLNVCDLKDGKEKSIYKIVNLDMRLYEGMRMFVHGEAKPDDPNLKDGDLTVFVRLGSDLSRNYYEYEMPLVLSDPDLEAVTSYNSDEYPLIVWPEDNNFEVIFQTLKDLKIERNNSGTDLAAIYPLAGSADPNNANARIRIKGNPNLGDVKSVMIGIRNPVDDNLSHCAEIWVNEMRVYGLDEKGGAAALARVDMQLADLGNVSLAGNYSSIGFGALDQQLLERSREEITQVDVATNLNLDKFLPESWGVKVPFYAQYSQTASTPQFDPYDLDLTLDEKLEGSDPADRDSIRTLARDVTSISSFNFTNVRKERTNNEKKPRPWDIENFSVSYSESVTRHRDPIVENEEIRRKQGALDYNYSAKSKFIEPFKKLFGGDIKYLKFITDLNFNPIPNSFGFSTIMDRQLSQITYRFAGTPENSTFYNKRWTWDRNYNLNWDISRALKFNFSALNNAVIDEPEGLIDTEAKREIVWDNIEQLGRNKNYSHNFAINYNLPFKLFPFLEWIDVRATYDASFSWSAAALNTIELGNVIQNNQNRTVTADLDFERLYNKSNFLKKINSGNRSRGRRPSRGRSRSRGNEEASGPGASNERESGEPSKLTRAIIRPLMFIRKLRVSYNESFGTVVPGYLPETEFIGLSEGFSSPGWDFVAGLQPNIRTQDYYTENDWLYNNWNWISGDQLLNQQVTQDYSQNIEARLTLEPIPGFKVDIESNRSYQELHSEFFRRDTVFGSLNDRFQGEFEHLIPRDVGSFSMTYFTLNTLFTDDLEELFNQFEDNRSMVANRICPDCPTHSDPFQGDTLGYPSGYGRVQQSVLIPAFLAAYTGKDAQEVDVNEDYTKVLFNELPRVNWRLTYSGLSKVKPFSEIFSNFNLTHGYRSTLTVNSFQTELLFNNNDPTRENPETGDYYSRFEIPDIVISEALSPLIGLDMRMQNGVSLRMDFKKSRNLQLSFVDNGLNETKTTEYVVGFGYRLRNVEFNFGKKPRRGRGQEEEEEQQSPQRGQGGRGGAGGARNNGDLDISFDFSLRDDVTYRFLLDQDIVEPTRGTRAITISPAAEYQLNSQLALRFFIDYRRTVPKISQSFPITNTQAGITVRFTLQ